MPRLASKQVAELRVLTGGVIQRLLQLHTSWCINHYLREEKGRARYDDLEEELHNSYVIKGLGVRATPSRLQRVAFENGGYIIDEVDLAPEDAVGQVSDFPLDAASIAYAFALVEGYGNDVATYAMEKPVQRGDWHSPISHRLSFGDFAAVTNARNQLAANLNVPARRVRTRMLRRLASLKGLRNEIVHEAKTRVSFEAELFELLGVVCDLHFTCAPSDQHIIVYPWTDFDDQFSLAWPRGPGVYVRHGRRDS